ncbi:unnamed protein product, partial [marine sediment metagenome]
LEFALSLLCSFVVCRAAQEQPIVSKVKIKSSLLGKDRFLQHYLHEAGDSYDPAQHSSSLSILQDELIDDGYLDALVKDALSFDEQRNTVAVTLHLEPGTRFTIADVIVDITGRPQERRRLTEELLELLSGPLIGEYAKIKILNEQGQRLRSFLVRRGYLNPQITLSKQRDDTNTQLTLQYDIRLHKRHEYRFIGNQFFTAGALLDDLLSLEEQGISLPPSLLAQDIEDLYKKKGFTQAKVAWHEEHELLTF